MSGIELDRTATDGDRAVAISSASDPLIGQTLAHFEIRKRIGAGGMGEVYLARDLALARPVAVKVLRQEVSADPQLRERFLREARAQAKLQHPNVCHIYFIGEQSGRLFFAMEYLHGKSLRELLRAEGALQPSRALEYCRQAALGLREAHRNGFIHRDIKPSNLMLDRHGRLKIVDFGLAKHQGSAETAGTELTAGTSIVGTPLYMSPEQARSDDLDFRADMYSLGVTLHHLIAGAPPFRGKTSVDVIAQHLAVPRPEFAVPKHRKLETGLQAIEALCDRMMAKRPEARFADYGELVEALHAVSPVNIRPAGLIVRMFAYLIDEVLCAGVGALVIVGLTWLVGVVTGASELSGPLGLVDLVLPLYCFVLWAQSRQTVGAWTLSIQVVPLAGRGRLGWRGSLVRCAVLFGPLKGLEPAMEAAGISNVALTVAGISLLVALLGHAAVVSASNSKRLIWDRVAGTQVCYKHSRGRGAIE